MGLEQAFQDVLLLGLVLKSIDWLPSVGCSVGIQDVYSVCTD